MQPTIQSADLALAIYLEPLVPQRRVLWLGEPEGDGLARLARLAANLKILSPSARPMEGLRVAKLKPGPLALRDGSFDLIVVPDLAGVGLNETDRVDELHAALSSRGVLLAGASMQNDKAPSTYEQLFQLVAPRFRSTRMLGQASFDAWAVVDFRAAERGVNEVVVDGSAVAADQPLRTFAWASDDVELEVDPYSVVRVPSSKADQSASRERSPELVRELEAALDRSEALDERVGDLERTLAKRTAELEKSRTAAEDGAGGTDHDRLEASLRRRSQEVRDAEGEIERLKKVSRDLIERLSDSDEASTADSSLGLGATLRPSVASPSSRAAMERAVAAEAARAAAEFEADELRGQLLEKERLRREWVVEEARLHGRIRGLQVRSAELALSCEASEARASQSALDLDEARRRASNLKREMAARPALAAEATQLPLSEWATDGKQGEALVRYGGEVAGLRDLLRHRQAALSAAQADARAAAELRRCLEEARQQLGQVRAELGEARAALDDQGELEKRTKEAEAETDRLRQVLPARTSSIPPKVQDEMATLGAEADGLRHRLSDAETQCAEHVQRVAELSAALGARDALVSRLQLDLAGSERRRDDFDDHMDRLREENRRLRDALVDASDQVDEVSALQSRLTTAEANARRHGEALHEARDSARGHQDAVLSAERERDFAREQRESLRRDLEEGREQLRQTLREVRQGLDGLSGVLGANASTTLAEITAVGIASPGEGFDHSDEMAALRNRIDTLEREAADHDTLLHSTRAQLEERDDRIRALETRLTNRSPIEGSGEALKQEVLELRERSARLAEELDHERRARAIGARSVPPDAGASDDGDIARSILGKDREIKGLREANAQARAGLEELLGATTMSDPATAERIGALLRILR